jgi:hypothetical protein
MNALLKYTLFALGLTAVACHSKKNVAADNELPSVTFDPEALQAIAEKPLTGLPPAIIYKTIGNFDNLVPVTMNADHTEIVSYPAVTDVYYEGKLAKPAKLKNGYLLDNRGISLHTAFLDYTYEQYAALPQTPSRAELLQHIKHRYPLLELYECGSRYQTVEELNRIVESNFANCGKAETPKVYILPQ